MLSLMTILVRAHGSGKISTDPDHTILMSILIGAFKKYISCIYGMVVSFPLSFPLVSKHLCMNLNGEITNNCKSTK